MKIDLNKKYCTRDGQDQCSSDLIKVREPLEIELIAWTDMNGREAFMLRSESGRPEWTAEEWDRNDTEDAPHRLVKFREVIKS